MKAKKANSKSRDTNCSEYNLKINEKTNESTLELKKSKKDTVNNFSEWMKVWNDFLHTRLHFHPEEAYLLLTYQRHITDSFGTTSCFTFVSIHCTGHQEELFLSNAILPVIL